MSITKTDFIKQSTKYKLMNNTYEKINSNLTSKEKFHISLGLQRITKILRLLGNPHKKIKTIHIAGTNGKGSTSAMLATVLKNSGYKTGLYTSPHLIKYNERIKISGEDIPDEIFNSLLEKINATALQNDIPLTEFEMLTAVAFCYFAEENTDINIIETGLGGRLDATNVITPVMEVITSISLDHTERLGGTIDEIAKEKAGVIKQNSTVIINQNNNGLKTIQTKAKETNSKLVIAEIPQKIKTDPKKTTITINEKTYRTNLIGEFQGDNLALVVKTLDELKKIGYTIKDEETSLMKVLWPARMQFLDKNIVIDGAHNPSAAKSLRNTLDEIYPNKDRVWFFGALKNKDFDKSIKFLFKNEDIVYFVKFNSPNSCGEEEFQKYLTDDKRSMIDISDVLGIINRQKNEQKLSIICGSLYLAGELLAQLGD